MSTWAPLATVALKKSVLADDKVEKRVARLDWKELFGVKVLVEEQALLSSVVCDFEKRK